MQSQETLSQVSYTVSCQLPDTTLNYEINTKVIDPNVNNTSIFVLLIVCIGQQVTLIIHVQPKLATATADSHWVVICFYKKTRSANFVKFNFTCTWIENIYKNKKITIVESLST